MRHITPNLASQALCAAPDFPPAGRWTPMTYTHERRGDAAYAIAVAIRQHAFVLTTEERVRLAAELLAPHSTDHARFELFGEPA